MSGGNGRFILPGTVKQGYLTKSPPMDTWKPAGWKKRWCILAINSSKEPYLDYYHDEQTFVEKMPIKRIPLAQCWKVEQDLQHSNYKHIFAVHVPERVYYFSAPSNYEMIEWVDALCTRLKLTNFRRGESIYWSKSLPKNLSAGNNDPSLPSAESRCHTFPLINAPDPAPPPPPERTSSSPPPSSYYSLSPSLAPSLPLRSRSAPSSPCPILKREQPLPPPPHRPLPPTPPNSSPSTKSHVHRTSRALPPTPDGFLQANVAHIDDECPPLPPPRPRLGNSASAVNV